MTQQQPSAELAALMASDLYWGEPVVEFTADAARKIEPGIVGEIGITAMSLAGGGFSEELAQGDDFPVLPEGSHRVIRIVEDSRIVVRKNSAHYRTLQAMRQSDEEHERSGAQEGFDGLAAQALDPSVLHCHPATTVRSTSSREAVRVGRAIYYMRPITKEGLGVSVASVFVQSQQDLEHAQPEVIPIIPLGSTYGRGNKIMSKIVRADLMEATGIIWRDNTPEDPPSKLPLRSGSLARLAPRLND